MSCGLTRRVASPVFVGRGAELDTLRRVFERTASGQPAALLIAGEAGVGKSRLVAELLRHAGEQGATTLTGGCVDVGDGMLAYAPVVEALRGLAAAAEGAELDDVLGNARQELARLVPELDTTPQDTIPLDTTPAAALGRGADGGAGVPGRIFELLLGVIGRLAGRGPVLLVVEDLQWADQSTRALLGYLARNLRGRVCLVGTYRTDEPAPRHPLRGLLAELERGGRTEWLDLRRLRRGELAELLAGILGHPAPAGLADEIWARSDGNPCYAEELLAAHRAGHTEGHLHRALRDLLLARVEALSEPAQRLLEVAAVAGRRVDHDLLAAVAGQPPDQLVGLLRDVVSHHLLVAEGGGTPGAHGDAGYRFRHALIQEAVYDRLLPVERGRLHAAFASVLAARVHDLEDDGRIQRGDDGVSAADLGQLAHHADAAGDLDVALAAAVRAGQAAEAAYAMPEALRHYERAVELWDLAPAAAARSPLDRPGLLARAARVVGLLGDLDRAVTLVKEALAATDPAADPLRAGALLERLSHYQREAGDHAAAMVTLERALEVTPAAPPSAEQARALAARGRLLLLRHRDLKRAVSDCEQAAAMARQVGARADEGRALTTLGCVRCELGQVDEGMADLQRAHRIAEALGDPEGLCAVAYHRTALLGASGRFRAAAEAGLEGWQMAGRLGLARTHGVSIAAEAAQALIRLGRLEDAGRLLGEALVGDQPPGVLLQALPARGLLRLRQGDVAAAAADFALVLDRCRGMLELEPQHAARVFAGLAEAATWDGRLDDARAAAVEGLDLVAESDQPAFVIPVCAAGLAAEADRAELARARHAAGDRDEAHRVARDLIRRARTAAGRPGVTLKPPARAELATAEAEWSRAAGRGEGAPWSSAAAGWDAVGAPWPAAYARWRQGETLLAGGVPREDAGGVLRAAWTAARELGARRLTQELEALARRGRVELPTAADPPAPESAATPRTPGEAAAAEFGLTPRELEVLVLVADGRTNREIAETLFISDKTASVHVSNILAKLGVPNRGQAAATAHRLGLGG